MGCGLAFLRRLNRLLVGLRRLFVAVASVIGFVETRSLEDDASSGADESDKPGLAALGTFAFHRRGDLLKQFKFVTAGIAAVFIRGHVSNRIDDQ